VLVRNARWLDESGRFIDGCIQIKEGKIFPLPGKNSARTDESELNAENCLLLPGLIDPHVHFRQPGDNHKEGIENGSRAAIFGGVTTVLDMPNNNTPCDNLNRFERKKALFQRLSLTNWGLHLAVPSRKSFLPHSSKFASVKIFMANSSKCPAFTKIDDLIDIFSRFPRVTIHAEDESWFPADVDSQLPHSQKRPRKAITSALEKIERAYSTVLNSSRNQPPCRLILLHISTIEEIEWVRNVKRQGWDIWAETCPHYLFFTEEEERNFGSVFRVNPPLRSSEDRIALRKALQEGTIDFVGSDHAPHAPFEKLDPCRAPSGMPGIEWLMPLLLKLVEDNFIDWKTFLSIGCKHAAKCYGISNRNGISEGNFADLVLVTPSTLSPALNPVLSRAGYNPYQNFSFPWKIQYVLINGEVVFSKGIFSSKLAGREVF